MHHVSGLPPGVRVPSARDGVAPPCPIAPRSSAPGGSPRCSSAIPSAAKPHTHAGWYAADPRTTIVAGCDVDAERLSSFGEDWGVDAAHLYDDYRAAARARAARHRVGLRVCRRPGGHVPCRAGGGRSRPVDREGRGVHGGRGRGARPGGRCRRRRRRRGLSATAGRTVSRRRALGPRRDVRASRERSTCCSAATSSTRGRTRGTCCSPGAGRGHGSTRRSTRPRTRRRPVATPVSETRPMRHDTPTH